MSVGMRYPEGGRHQVTDESWRSGVQWAQLLNAGLESGVCLLTLFHIFAYCPSPADPADPVVRSFDYRRASFEVAAYRRYT